MQADVGLGVKLMPAIPSMPPCRAVFGGFRLVLAVCVSLAGCGSRGGSGSLARNASPVLVEQQEFIFDPDAAGIPSSHASTLVESPLGILAAWYGGSEEGNSDVKIYTAILDARSRAWSAPVAVAAGVDDNGQPTATEDPVLFRAAGGTILLFYKEEHRRSKWRGRLMSSTDGGASWSAPKLLPDGILGPAKNKPIELADGTVICPSSGEDPDPFTIQIQTIRPTSIDDYLDRSRWTIQTDMNHDGLSAIESALVDYGSGELQMLARSSNGFVLSSRSVDGGKHWTPLSNLRLENPNSPVDATLLADGRSLVVYNSSKTDRTPLVVAVSRDHGRSWADILTLEDQPGEFSYPSVILASDRSVHVTYTWNRQNIKHVAFNPVDNPNP
jgi:predicted neuraminidase